MINSPMIDAQFAQAKAALDSQKAKYNLAVVTAQRYLALRKSRAVRSTAASDVQIRPPSPVVMFFVE